MGARDGDDASDCSTRIIPNEMRAPWRTKSTLSLVIGSRISTASCKHGQSPTLAWAPSDTHLEASASTSNAERERGTTADVGVVALGQQLDNPWYLRGVLEEQEGKTRNSSTTNVVRSVRYGDVQKLPDGGVV